MRCFKETLSQMRVNLCYRPLAGMRCFPITLASATPSPCYRPLAGMRCFIISRAKENGIDRLPSPCGDEVFQKIRRHVSGEDDLPSPCGDEVFPAELERMPDGYRLPSPCGDEVFPLCAAQIRTKTGSYRPLAGMRRFTCADEITAYLDRLPSPCGDEVFLETIKFSFNNIRYRPLAGMRCFQSIMQILVLQQMVYRPLAGMRCFRRGLKRRRRSSGYRPLAGMRCFSGYLVYVPSGFTVTVPLRGCGVSYEAEVEIREEKLPSPCGDEVFQQKAVIRATDLQLFSQSTYIV